MSKKEIITEELSLKDLKKTFGNPRKITAKKLKELQESIERHGDFGVFVINEKNEIISGHQRASALEVLNPDAKVLCKKLVGYSDAELRSINIMANTHAGEWDINKLAEWTADLNLNLGLDLNNKAQDDIKIRDMELIRFERYNYVLIACRNENDYNNLARKLGIDGKTVIIAPSQKGGRRIKARAIWYDDVQCKL